MIVSIIAMPRINKLTNREQEELVLDLVNAFVKCQTLGDAATFLQDLLTINEMKILAKRLRIAKLLINGMTYDEIRPIIHTSNGTIAKIAAWLAERGEGFRKIIKALPKQSTDKKWHEYSDWDKLKRQYSIYFWPELLLEEIIKNANQRQKDRIYKVLIRLKEKSDLHKRIENLLLTNSNTTL